MRGSVPGARGRGCAWGDPHFRWLGLRVPDASEVSFGHLEVHRWGSRVPSCKRRCCADLADLHAVHAACLGPCRLAAQNTGTCCPRRCVSSPLAPVPVAAWAAGSAHRAPAATPGQSAFLPAGLENIPMTSFPFWCLYNSAAGTCPPPCSARCAEPSGEPMSPVSRPSPLCQRLPGMMGACKAHGTTRPLVVPLRGRALRPGSHSPLACPHLRSVSGAFSLPPAGSGSPPTCGCSCWPRRSTS